MLGHDIKSELDHHTIFISSVLHSVGSVPFIGDVRICVGAWRVNNAGFDVVSSGHIVSPGVHNKVCIDFSKDSCKAMQTTSLFKL